MVSSTKVCTKCREKKSLDDFYRDRRRPQGRQAQCKVCKTVQYNEWRKRTGYDARRYRTERDKELERHLISKYGIDLTDYQRMFDNQNGCCAICKKPHRGTRRFDVDHDHNTLQVRGLLCTSCNRMLGHAKDIPEVLRAAADYLEQFRK